MRDNEIELYVNDSGVVSCHMGCDDWIPAYDLVGRRTNLEELIETVRRHSVAHLNPLRSNVSSGH